MNVIDIENLTKYYGKSRGIIDINLKVKQGEIFGFIGPNGAGKSTTIRTLLNFIFPTKGKATVLGWDVVKDSKLIKREIGYLPSEVNYYEDMKVNELFKYSASFYKIDCSERIKELVDIFEIDINKRIDSLSLGNKKKIGIAQALLHEPKLLILDEPTSGLDPLMQKNFFEVIKKENDKGITIFFSSHNLNEVQRLCNRVAIIKEGKILKVEEIEKIRGNQLKKVKLIFKNNIDAENFSLPEIIHSNNKNGVYEFIFNGNVNGVVKALAKYELENLWMEEPTLEEAFMQYYEKEEKR